MNIYCTLFDQNYVARGLALYDSLSRGRKQFVLVILCLDDATHHIMTTLALPHVKLVSLPLLEKTDPELARVRPQRSAPEFYFTCKPALMRLIAEEYESARRVTYLDADLFYFSDPDLLDQKCADSSVALTPHRFPGRLSGRAKYGYFNAGWVSSSTNSEGRRFVDWWRARCIDWCRLEVESNRFGDQKYLNEVPEQFRNVCLIEDPGANLAPWNLEGVSVRKVGSRLEVNGTPLYFFHFHGLRKVFWKIYDSGLYDYSVALAPVVRSCIFRPYLSNLAARTSDVKRLFRKEGMLEATAGSANQNVLRPRMKRVVRLVADRTCVIGP